MTVYVGTNSDSVVANGALLDMCLDVASHSPEGFAWGGRGLGPSQLACAIMVNEYGRDLKSHPLHYQKLKEELISKIKGSSFTITSEDVMRVINSNAK